MTVCVLQVTAFEPEAQEAAPVKAAVAAAEQLTALLAGSKQVNPRKGGAGVVAGISAAPQVKSSMLGNKLQGTCGHSMAGAGICTCSPFATASPVKPGSGTCTDLNLKHEGVAVVRSAGPGLRGGCNRSRGGARQGGADGGGADAGAAAGPAAADAAAHARPGRRDTRAARAGGPQPRALVEDGCQAGRRLAGGPW